MKASDVEKQGKKKGSKSTPAKMAGLVLILAVVAGGAVLFMFFNRRSSSSAAASNKSGIYTVRRGNLTIRELLLQYVATCVCGRPDFGAGLSRV